LVNAIRGKEGSPVPELLKSPGRGRNYAKSGPDLVRSTSSKAAILQRLRYRNGEVTSPAILARLSARGTLSDVVLPLSLVPTREMIEDLEALFPLGKDRGNVEWPFWGGLNDWRHVCRQCVYLLAANAVNRPQQFKLSIQIAWNSFKPVPIASCTMDSERPPYRVAKLFALDCVLTRKDFNPVLFTFFHGYADPLFLSFGKAAAVAAKALQTRLCDRVKTRFLASFFHELERE